MGACAVALWCAVLVASAAAYTVDCNHEYADCDTELSKLAAEDEERSHSSTTSNTEIAIDATVLRTTSTVPPTRSTPKIADNKENRTDIEARTEALDATDITESTIKPKPRLLNLNVDELQNFAIALHNQSSKENKKDLSDVNLDGDDDEESSKNIEHGHKHDKDLPDRFYSNLQAPFHPLVSIDRSEEMDMCKENDIAYKIGERIERGCEETCECTPSGFFDCTPRCKQPFVRRGRRLTDPLCFESPVDECCSIIACATGNGDKSVKVEVCRFGNDTYPVGTKWNIGCEQTCNCEKNSIVTCKPRCNKPPMSEKCINVQDPADACCEVQVCDVSQDVHEEPGDNVTSSTERITKAQESVAVAKPSTRPLVLAEPIGSVKVLQNNTVQVNLMHMNNSQDPIHLLLSSDGGESFRDVELKYSNLILNLEGGRDYILKTKETGTKFNFTITTIDVGVSGNEIINATEEIGCYEGGIFYAVGEEFRIGCAELCECTGRNTKECARLECPSHVGLELVSKGCVRWAPSPPPVPPDCCPRAARCLSDGTCHYRGHAVPNWSEVPVSLTGCEQRCFCENGELDCQDVCTPLPPVPPQTLRCPPMHHPAAVNISDDDCCKQWGCLPNNAGNTISPPLTTGDMPTVNDVAMMNFVTPIVPMIPTIKPVLPIPTIFNSNDFYNQMNIIKTFPKYVKPVLPTALSDSIPSHSSELSKISDGRNITILTLEDIDSPFKTLQPEPPLIGAKDKWQSYNVENKMPMLLNTFRQSISDAPDTQTQTNPQINYEVSSSNGNDYVQKSKTIDLSKQMYQTVRPNSYLSPSSKMSTYDTIRKVPISKVDHLNYFLPAYNQKHPGILETFRKLQTSDTSKSIQSYFKPLTDSRSSNYVTTPNPNPLSSRNNPQERIPLKSHEKPVTVLRTNDIKNMKSTDRTNVDTLWNQDTKTHVLTKAPNPYETVLYRVPNHRIETSRGYDRNINAQRFPGKPYSTLDLEHLLKQMEVESEVNRNLGRSAVKNRSAAGQTTPEEFPSNPTPPQQPSFLPTVPPETPQRFPHEDIPDYEQNNIHRPVNPIDSGLPGLPPGLSIPPNYGEENKKLSVISLQADSPTSVKMLFGLPPVLVGLRGSVDLRYTDKTDEDVSHWYSQVFAPADEVLTTSRLEFRLTGLKPSTVYKVRGKLFLHNLPVEPESEIFTVRTQDMPTIPPIEEKRREIDSKLTMVDVNDTTAHVSWRYFTEDELQFIDGIQVRYRPVGTPIYSMTELLHHSRLIAELNELHPGSRYEASLVLIPPPRATTELYDPGRVEFTTSPYLDPYNWSVIIEARSVGAHAAELRWRGVPAPTERWVRVYRAAHACATRREHDSFRLAARDMPPTITLSGLEPDTRCRVWLELFLTNGKVKTSNVLEINTKPEDSNEPIDNEIASASVGSGGRGSPRGDYYGALVAVGVVAALGALTSLLLLLIVVRRHRPRSVPITPVPSAPRESSLPPYDNPAYKLELQQETMDL